MLTFIDHDRGQLEPTSLEALSFARKLGETVEAVLVGGAARPLSDKLFAYGARRVHLIEHAALDEYAPAAWSKSVAQLAASRAPEAIVAPGSDRGSEIMAGVAALLGQPMSANTVDVTVGPSYEVTRLRWGSSLWEKAKLSGTPKLLTVAPHVVPAEPAEPHHEGSVETFTPELADRDLRVRVVRREEEQTEGVTLKSAPVVVGGGRGVGSAEGFAVLEELAKLLGGAVGGSRVATNNGWRPHSDQVGLTGTRIAPQLYVACGISGAIQHMVGCKGAKNILVINKDREAPFFAKADYGVQGDLHEIVQAVVREIEKERGR